MPPSDDQSTFLRALEEIYDVQPGSLRSEMLLENLKEWNSLGKVEFMALADERYGVAVSGEQLRSCCRIGDLASLVLDGRNAESADGY